VERVLSLDAGDTVDGRGDENRKVNDKGKRAENESTEGEKSGVSNGKRSANGRREMTAKSDVIEAACLAWLSGTNDTATQTPLSAFQKVEGLVRQVDRLGLEEQSDLRARLYEHAGKLASDFAPADVLRCSEAAFQPGRSATSDAFFEVAQSALMSFSGDLGKAAAAMRLLTSAGEAGLVHVASR
jgi:hypothetical protein